MVSEAVWLRKMVVEYWLRDEEKEEKNSRYPTNRFTSASAKNNRKSWPQAGIFFELYLQ